MFDDEVAAFLRSGCAWIVGSASPDGRPLASRGWGVAHLDAAADRLTVLLDGDDLRARANLVPSARVAMTATSVHTLRSLQLKGTVRSVGPCEAEDAKVARAYCDAFFGDVEAVDGMHRDILERMVPEGWFRCAVDVDARFDQTPGPAAGAAIGAGR